MTLFKSWKVYENFAIMFVLSSGEHNKLPKESKRSTEIDLFLFIEMVGQGRNLGSRRLKH